MLRKILSEAPPSVTPRRLPFFFLGLEWELVKGQKSVLMRGLEWELV
jgi:hypothetical protein